MQSEILDLIFQGESETLEMKSQVRDPRLLAKLMGAVANNQGGKILIGVKEPPEVVGVDEAFTRRVYEAARRRLEPQPISSLSFIDADGKRVAKIEVQRSNQIVLTEGRPFVRAGTLTQPMAWTQMRQHLSSQSSAASIESLTKAIESQSKMIDEMHNQLRQSNTWQHRWKERAIGFFLGIVASIIASVAYAMLVAHVRTTGR